MGLGGCCVKLVATLPGRGMHTTTDHERPASKSLVHPLSVPGPLRVWGFPWDYSTHIGALPV